MPKTAPVLGTGKQKAFVQVAVHSTTPVGAMLHIELRVGGRLRCVFDGQQTNVPGEGGEPGGVVVSTTFRPGAGDVLAEVVPLVNGVDRSNRTTLIVATV